MLKNLLLAAGLCAVFCGCKKEEPYLDKTDYYGCNPSGGFVVKWHLTEYAVNDTSVRIAINDTVRFYASQQCSWNSVDTTYTTCLTPAYSRYTLTIFGSPYGRLDRSFYSINPIPNTDPAALQFSSSQAGVNYYFWGHRFP